MSLWIYLNHKISFAVLSLSLFALTPFHLSLAAAQEGQMGTEPAAQTDASNQQAMREQITQLRQQVAKLQEALQQSKTKMQKKNTQAMLGGSQPAMGMEGESSEMGGMGGNAPSAMQDDKGERGGMAGAKKGMGKGGMPMSDSGCCGMSSMGKPMAGTVGAKSSKMPEGAMPAPSRSMSAETPSLLHLGAKDFFLDHTRHLVLTPEQQTRLKQLKANAEQQKAFIQVTIDQSQQELWQLTGSGQPNYGQIDENVQQIAKLRADQQTSYIHAVADAAKVLTPRQQEEILKPRDMAKKAPPSKAPMASAPMKM